MKAHNAVNLKNARPFLRWAGGKSRSVRYLANCLPSSGFDGYWEPFLGAGAVYFEVAPRRACLSDSNAALIECYQSVRDNPDLVFRYLQEHARRNSERYYYEVRQKYNSSSESVAQAARFIYLNKTSFNGIFRVNTDGQYNVPYGHKEPPALPTLLDLRSVSALLKQASLLAISYEALAEKHRFSNRDFVYLDPPYPPTNGTAYFTHYTAERFSWDDQEKVAILANVLRAYL